MALRQSGFDYDEVFQRCVGVSNEWNYNAVGSNVADRFSQRYMRQRTVPMTHKTLEQVLNPQPVAQKARRVSRPLVAARLPWGMRPRIKAIFFFGLLNSHTKWRHTHTWCS